MVTHIVFFRLHEYSLENARALQARLASMEGNVPSLRQIEVGIDFDRAERAFDVALLTRFDAKADLDAYQNDPFHRDVIAYVRSVCKQTAVVDYES